jgi:hypothetical protein
LSGHLNPSTVAPGGTGNAAEDATALRKEVVAALHGVADRAHPLAVCAALGGLHTETHPLRSLLGRFIAEGPSGLRPRKIAWVGLLARDFRWRGMQPHRVEPLRCLTPGMRIGRGDAHASRHGAGVAREVQGGATLGAINRRRSGRFPPFFCWLLGAVEENLVPVDALELLVLLGEWAPSRAKG